MSDPTTAETRDGAARSTRDYLGDGVYVDFDGFAIVMTSENGVSVLDRIVLEPQVMAALRRYVNRIKTLPEGASFLY